MDVGIGQLVKQTGRCYRTLRRWESEGRIPRSHRIGLRNERAWSEQEAAQIRAVAGVAPEPDALAELLTALERFAPGLAERIEAITKDPSQLDALIDEGLEAVVGLTKR